MIDADNLSISLDKGVGRIELNRVDRANALDKATIEAFGRAVDCLAQDEACRAIVISGAGAHFCSGLDFADPPVPDLERLYTRGIGDREAIARARQPIVAAVQGSAAGAGAELALMCDIIIAAEDARFSFPEFGMGGLPGAGGCVRLVGLIGEKRAAELLFSGRTIAADEALSMGMVSRVVANCAAASEAVELAETIAAAPVHASLMLKEAVHLVSRDNEANRLSHERILALSALSLTLQAEGAP